jgi:RND family efflux transporter MFP subunit
MTHDRRKGLAARARFFAWVPFSARAPLAARAALAALAAAALAWPLTALAQPAPQQPLPVTVAKPVARTVTETAEFTGRFQASATVQVVSRVSGFLEKAPFTEGGTVKAGDVLFVIDARPFEAAAAQAQAQVDAQQTRLDLAQANFERSRSLQRTGNITDAAFQASQQAYLEAQAGLASARAALTNARLDLEFSTIRAPIDGRIGRKLITEGNLVAPGTQGQGSLLTTILAVDPIHFFFDVDESTYLTYRRLAQEGQPGTPPIPVTVALPDEAEFRFRGEVNYVDTQVDAATGTVAVRAILPNPDGRLTPGLFGRIRLPVGRPFEAFIVPDAAVGTSAAGNFVMTVNAEGVVAPRPVQTGPRFGAFRAIRSGLAATDQVIVNGLMRARPGGRVAPQPTELSVPADLGSPTAARR